VNLRDDVKRLGNLTAGWSEGTRKAAHAVPNSPEAEVLRNVTGILIAIPRHAAIVWMNRKRGDPWPDDAPWEASTTWAKAALVWESEGGSLSSACDQIMMMALECGYQALLAKWFAKGWVPSVEVLKYAGDLTRRRRRRNFELLLRDVTIGMRVKQLIQDGLKLVTNERTGEVGALNKVALELRMGVENIKKIYMARLRLEKRMPAAQRGKRSVRRRGHNRRPQGKKSS